MEIYKKFTKDVGLVAISKFVKKLKPIIFLPIITKSLGASDYGVYTTLIITITFLMSFSSFGLNFSIVRMLSSEKNKEKVRKTISSILFITILVSLTLAILLSLGSEYLADTVFGSPESVNVIASGIFLLVIHAVLKIFSGTVRMKGKMGLFSSFKLLRVFAPIILATIFILQGFGLIYVIYAHLLIEGILALLGVVIIIRLVGLSKPNFSILRPYLSFGVPLTLNSLSSNILHLGDRYIIALFLSASAVGVYAVAYALGDLVLMLLSPITLALLRPLSKSYDEGKQQQVKTYLNYSLRYFLLFALPIAVGISLLSTAAVRSLATKEFVDDVFIITSLVSLANIAYGLYIISARTLLLVKKTKLMASLLFSFAVSNIFLNLLLIPLIGIVGAALSTLVCYFSLLTITLIFSRKSGIRLSIEKIYVLKLIFAALLMGLVVYCMTPRGWFPIAFTALTGAAVYFILLFVFKAFRTNELSFFKSFLNKTDQELV
jgi:O-antigen/teichoic acid export membrane protein